MLTMFTVSKDCISLIYDLKGVLYCKILMYIDDLYILFYVYTQKIDRFFNIYIFSFTLTGRTPEEVVRRYLQKVRNPPEEVHF